MEEVKKKKTYRNFTRSEKSIIRAYLELVLEQEKITVTDIVERADLNRSTFYAHFKSVDDVHQKIENDVIEELLGSLNKNDYRNSLENPYIAMNRVREFIEKDEEMYKMLLNSDGANKFLERLRDIVIEQYMSDIVILPRIQDRDSFEMNVRLFVGGYVYVIKDWAAGNIKMSLDKCTMIMAESIKTCVKSYVKKAF